MKDKKEADEIWMDYMPKEMKQKNVWERFRRKLLSFSSGTIL